MPEGIEQVPDLRRETRIQCRGERALRCIELRAELVTAGDRPVTQCADPLPCPALVRRIAHGEHPGYRERLDLRCEFARRRIDRGLIERLALVTGRLVATAHAHHHAARALEPGALEHLLVEADEERADRA